MRLRGINHINLLYHSPKPSSDVFCFKLNFNISKLGYSRSFQVHFVVISARPHHRGGEGGRIKMSETEIFFQAFGPYFWVK